MLNCVTRCNIQQLADATMTTTTTTEISLAILAIDPLSAALIELLQPLLPSEYSSAFLQLRAERTFEIKTNRTFF